MKPKVTMESPPTSNAGKPKGLFEAVEEELRLRSYSPKTAKVYLGHLPWFLVGYLVRLLREQPEGWFEQSWSQETVTALTIIRNLRKDYGERPDKWA